MKSEAKKFRRITVKFWINPCTYDVNSNVVFIYKTMLAYLNNFTVPSKPNMKTVRR